MKSQLKVEYYDKINEKDTKFSIQITSVNYMIVLKTHI